MSRTVSREEMLKRVARFSELKPTDRKAIGGDKIPEGLTSFSIIGRGAANDPSLQPPIVDAQGFNTVIVKSQPGTGAPLHAHPTVEVFVALNSNWLFFWNKEDKEGQLALGPFDTISFPAGVMHGFRNVGSEEGSLYAILGGTNATRTVYEEK